MNSYPASYLGMRTGRPKKPLEIVDADREKVSMMARRPKSAQATAMRARIVVSCGEGMNNSEVARKPHITGAMFSEICREPRPFCARKLLIRVSKAHSWLSTVGTV